MLGNVIGAREIIQRMTRVFKLRMVFLKPLLVLRIIRLLARYFLTKNNRLWDANLAITPECNLNCEHCFARTFKLTAEKDPEKRPLSTEEIIGVIREHLALGVLNFDFQGGEVFLHPDLEKIIKACKPYKSYISIITNGTLITEEWLKRLRKWGVDQIVVSIDSMNPEEHDDFRRRGGTWQKAIKALEMAQKEGFTVTVNTTISHQTLHSDGIVKLQEYCLEKGIQNWVFIGIPIGNWSSRMDVLIDREDHDYLKRLAQKTNNRIRRDLSPHLFRDGCPAVKEGIYMTPYGDILPCPFIHISIGNIRDHRLEDILDRAKTMEEFRNHSPVCLIGEDPEFIRKYGEKSFNSSKIPLDGEKIFGFEKLPPRTEPLA